MGSREIVLRGEDLTPFHTDASTSEISNAYEYVNSIINTSDYENDLAWHGWALREAFLAGRASMPPKEK